MAGEEDWGGSDGAKLAAIKAEHDHKKNERKFQVQIMLMLVGMVSVLCILQMIDSAIIAKDVILIVLPAFTFVLGKLDTGNG